MSQLIISKENVPKVYRPYFKEFTPKIQIYYGSRNSAKSDYIASQILFKSLKYDQERCILVRQHHNSIKDSQWDTVKAVWDRWVKKNPDLLSLFTARFNVSPLEIRYSNGARMIARGMDETGKTKSIKDPTTVWFEEMDEISEDAFWDTVLSLRTPHDVPLNVFCSFNPSEKCDPDHWIVQNFFPDPDGFQSPDGKFHEVESIRDDTMILHTTYLDNPYCDAEQAGEFDRLAERDPIKYQMKGLGLIKRIQSTGVLIPTFDRRVHLRPLELDRESALWFTLDFNVNPAMHCGVMQFVRVGEKIEIRVLDEIVLENPRNSTKDVCLEYKNLYGHHPSHFYTGDATGKNRQTISTQYKNNFSVVQDVLAGKLHSTSDKVPKRNPNLLTSRDFIRDLFGGMYDHISIVIDESKCPTLIKDLERMREDKDGKPFKEKITKDGVTFEKYGHSFDWFKYGVISMLENLYSSRK